MPKRPFQLQEKKLHNWGNLKKSKYHFTTVTSTSLVYNYIPSLTEMGNADGSLVRTGLSSNRQIEFLFILGVYCCLVVQTSPRSPWMQRQTDCFHFPSFFPLLFLRVQDLQYCLSNPHIYVIKSSLSCVLSGAEASRTPKRGEKKIKKSYPVHHFFFLSLWQICLSEQIWDCSQNQKGFPAAGPIHHDE